MKRSVRAAREIAFWQPRFRLLEGWTIEFDTEDEFKGQSHHNVRDKKGLIFDWGRGIMPRDYIFHEMLHFAWAVVRVAKKYLGPGGSRECEETVVQDLSRIVIYEQDIPGRV